MTAMKGASASTRGSARRQITLDAFIRRRLGGGDNLSQLRRMFGRSFGASTLGGFWRYWNPVYAYLLERFCYRPLRRLLPRPVAVVATFFCSGFLLHDLPFWWGVAALKTHTLPIPFVGLWFTLMAALTLVAEKLKIDYSSFPLGARVAVNVSHIALAWLAALAIVRMVS